MTLQLTARLLLGQGLMFSLPCVY